MILQGQVGPQATSTSFPPGQQPNVRLDNLGNLVSTDGHGRFYEQCYRGNLYSFGISNTTLVAANAIATGLTATAQPIIGVYNPTGSGFNMVILQAVLNNTTIANTAVSPGGFMWVYSTGNAAVSTGSTPISQNRLTASGSIGKAFAISTALTGLTNNLAVLRASGVPVFNAAGAATAVALIQGAVVDNVDGSIIVPPGGVVGVMGQVSTVTASMSVSMLWEEVPI